MCIYIWINRERENNHLYIYIYIYDVPGPNLVPRLDLIPGPHLVPGTHLLPGPHEIDIINKQINSNGRRTMYFTRKTTYSDRKFNIIDPNKWLINTNFL